MGHYNPLTTTESKFVGKQRGKTTDLSDETPDYAAGSNRTSDVYWSKKQKA